MKNKRIFIIIILIFIGAMFWIWAEKNTQKESEDLLQDNHKQTAEESAEYVTEQEGSGWKDYANSDFSYSFQYPSEWQLFTSAPVLKWSFFDQGQVVAVRWFNESEPISYFLIRPTILGSGELSLIGFWLTKVFTAGLEGLKVKSNESLEFQGYSARKLAFYHPEVDYTEISYFILKENIVYEITAASLNFEEEDFDYMFLNFRFLK